MYPGLAHTRLFDLANVNHVQNQHDSVISFLQLLLFVCLQKSEHGTHMRNILQVQTQLHTLSTLNSN